ncbi:amidohydrolase family protein [Nakamurella alba]|uniref:amidohydrolase family protein n=1 Tax=Nakamurella alba TaxID=2665158 RepID=UPI0018AA8FDB|nr:amidohydrolase family protein [Nakamurella alba]
MTIDAHVHLYDSSAIGYGVFAHRDPTFEALLGDYSALPRSYSVADYRLATAGRKIDGIVWHEFISDDPEAEIRWAQDLADTSDLPMALVGLADFADPLVEARLELLEALPNVTAVRQHLGWDPVDPVRRMTSRPDHMTDPVWDAGLARLGRTDLRCALEVFAPQLAELTAVVRRHPDIGFTIAVLGWPTALDPDSRSRWRADMAALARCGNTVLSISAVECIFGPAWDEDTAVDWITEAVGLFGTDRSMFGSHLPIDGLSYGFHRLYQAYDRVLAGCSPSERDAAYHGTAQRWYRMPVC